MAPTVTCEVAPAKKEDAKSAKVLANGFIQCKICLNDCPQKKTHKLYDCGCIFCKECLRQYLSISIREGNVLSVACPDSACNKHGEVSKQEIEKLVNHSTYEKYKRLRKRKEVAVDQTKTFCPIPGCEGICDGIPGVAQPVNCSECGYTFCFVCKERYHPDISCKEHRQLISDSTSGVRFVDILDGDIKECPICQVLIQRDAGCAQMMCGNCKHIFCWHCRKSLDSDIMLRHYDKGPCRDKLGHSRASLFLHRTQVVAGFVFFGVMIIVASPFILLVSPCLLLSKCFVGKS